MNITNAIDHVLNQAEKNCDLLVKPVRQNNNSNIYSKDLSVLELTLP